MKRVTDRSRINETMSGARHPAHQSNGGYDPIHLINNFWVSILAQPTELFLNIRMGFLKVFHSFKTYLMRDYLLFIDGFCQF